MCVMFHVGPLLLLIGLSSTGIVGETTLEDTSSSSLVQENDTNYLHANYNSHSRITLS